MRGRRALPLACATLLFLLASQRLHPQESDKRVLAVLDLTGDGISETEAVALTKLLVSSIFDSGLVEVIDRNRRNQILEEIEFSLSDCSEESCAIEIGKLLAADVMAIGAVHRLGSRLAVDLKAVEVESSRIVATYYQVYDSLDQIVDQIPAIGGEFAQNITGMLAAKREVLGYELLVPLVVTSNVEGARVLVNGASAGRISQGRFSKAVNRDSEVLLELSAEGYYRFRKKIMMDEAKAVDVTLDRIERHRFAFDLALGGGAMAGLHFGVFIVPNWWYVRVGVAATVSSLDPFYMSLPAFATTGTFLFADDRKPVRPHVGGIVVWNPLAVYRFTTIVVKPMVDTKYLSFGIISGVEVKLARRLRAALDVQGYVGPLLEALFGSRGRLRHAVQIGASLRYAP